MGSFTSLTATQIMRAIFPTSTSSHTALTTSNTTPSGYKIYNSHTGAASQIGLYSAGSAVVHSCNLVLGTNSAQTNPQGSTMTDSNFTTSPAVGGITGSTTQAGSLSYPVTGSYVGYTGMVMVATGTTGNHTWTGWTLSETSNKGQAVSASQIGFPGLGAGSQPQNVYGFVISAHSATSVAPNSASQLVSSNGGGTPVVIAYGDLSSGRQLTQGDTPVFADGAITITLE